MKNVGGIDKILRIIVGLALIAMVFIGPKTVWDWHCTINHRTI